MSAENIEVITLSRGTAEEDGNWVSGGGHRVHANWTDAEREVKARVLRSLAARSNPPDGVAFVRGWETLSGTPGGAGGSGTVRILTAEEMDLRAGGTQNATLDGITQSGSFGPAAEMAAAARDVQAKPKGRRGR